MEQYSSFGERLLAMIIDDFVITIIGSFLIVLWGFYTYIEISWLIGALYFILFEGSNWNATLGKKAMGIIVVDQSGNGITYGTAVVRYLGKIVSALILFIGYIMAAFSDTNQALHDKIAKTYVVQANSALMGETSFARQRRQVGTGYIVGISGEFAGKAFPLPPSGILMGRDTAYCQIIFSPTTQGVSRHHCQISFNQQSGMFVINEAGSTYGTFTMNGARIQSGKPITLGIGEKFYLGSKSNIFEVRL